MNTEVMFSRASDEWSTPEDFFRQLDDEFSFDIDVAADPTNRKCGFYWTREDNALIRDWTNPGGLEWLEPVTAWCNPPYSKSREFIAKASQQAAKGVTTVMLIPARTDTRAWHAHIWDAEKHRPKDGVEVRFIKGRLKFGGSKNSAPFPSAVVIFRPPQEQ